MTYHNAVKYILNAPAEPPADSIKSFENMTLLCNALENPQKNLKYIRLAGSNGKTICSAMLTSVLKNTDYRVGCLTLPMREDVRENIRIGTRCLSMEEVVHYVEKVAGTVLAVNARLQDQADITIESEEGNSFPVPMCPTRSEILLTMALLAFRDHDCTFCLIESDHSGADPSKFLPAPFAAVICGSIPSEEKREIYRIRSYIRRGVQEIISAPQNKEAYQLLSDTCASVNCRLTIPSRSQLKIDRLSLRGTDFSYRDCAYTLRLCGRFQVFNALVALETLEMLQRRGYPVSYEAVHCGFSDLHIPGKFEVLSLMPLIIADSTHTPIAIHTVCESMTDFKGSIGNRIRLFLPSEELTACYHRELTSFGYEVESAAVFGKADTGTSGNETLPCPLHCYTSLKKAVRDTLATLENNSVLLISGSHAFTASVRYEILRTLGF